MVNAILDSGEKFFMVVHQPPLKPLNVCLESFGSKILERKFDFVICQGQAPLFYTPDI